MAFYACYARSAVCACHYGRKMRKNSILRKIFINLIYNMWLFFAIYYIIWGRARQGVKEIKRQIEIFKKKKSTTNIFDVCWQELPIFFVAEKKNEDREIQRKRKTDNTQGKNGF